MGPLCVFALWGFFSVGLLSFLLCPFRSAVALTWAELRRERRGVMLYRVQVFRVRVEYESVGVEYESSTSRVLRIHSKKWGSSLKKLVFRVQQFSLFIAFLFFKKNPSRPPKIVF